MSLCAFLDTTTGRLSNIADRAMGPGDVPLLAMPSGLGPFAYDSANMVAVPAALATNEKLDRAQLAPRLLAALALKASPTTWATLTLAKQQAVQQIIDAAASQIATILG